MNLKKPFLFFVLFCLVVPLSFGFDGESSSYAFNSTNTGLVGDNSETSSYTVRLTQDYNQPSTNNATSSTYEANVGWYEGIPDPVPPTSSGGSGGGGGGGSSCSNECGPGDVPFCGEDGIRYTCERNHDLDTCFEFGAVPCEANEFCQNGACIPKCQENWVCEEWDTCSPDGLQGRTCEDFTNCGSVEARPALQRTCTPERTPLVVVKEILDLVPPQTLKTTLVVGISVTAVFVITLTAALFGGMTFRRELTKKVLRPISPTLVKREASARQLKELDKKLKKLNKYLRK
jgi:hypothetical protein